MDESLPEGECHVWWARLSDADPRLRSLLDSDEQVRLATPRRAADRDRFLVGCALTRSALARYLSVRADQVRIDRACEWCARPHGKPRLANVPAPCIQWSVSHAGERIGVAFAFGTLVGLDVEERNPGVSIEEMAPHVLSPREQGSFAAIPSERRLAAFFTYWTRKEAVVKATGRGLTIQPETFEVSEPEAEPRLLTSPWEPGLAGRVSMHDLPINAGYAACVAVIGDCSRVVTRDGSALIQEWCQGRQGG